MTEEERAAKRAAYRAANREILRQKQRAYYAANKEREALRVGAWRKANPLRVRQLNARYRFNRNAAIRLAVGAAAITLLTDYLESSSRG